MMQGAQQDNDISDNEIDDSRVSDNDNGSFDTEDNNRRELDRQRQERHNKNIREGYVRVEDYQEIQRRLAEYEDMQQRFNEIANQGANIPPRENLQQDRRNLAVGDHANGHPGDLIPDRRGRNLAVGDHANGHPGDLIPDRRGRNLAVGDHANGHPGELIPDRRGRVLAVGDHANGHPGELIPDRRGRNLEVGDHANGHPGDLIHDRRGRNLGQDVDDNFSEISSIRWRDISEERRFQAGRNNDVAGNEARRIRAPSNDLNPRRFVADDNEEVDRGRNPRRNDFDERRINDNLGAANYRGRNIERENSEDRDYRRNRRNNDSEERRENAGDNNPNERRRNPRRHRSPSSAHTDKSNSTRGDLDNTMQEIANLFTPPPASADDYLGANGNGANGNRFLAARSIQEELGRETAKRVKKSLEHYVASGPPMLQENVTLQGFIKWQSNLKTFVSKLPGYVEGMLSQRPDINNMSRKDRDRLADIYENIHGWLAKAGSMHTKVNTKTKNLKMTPLPDIVGWWKAVNDIFALSKSEIERRKIKLRNHYQLKDESCVSYCSRFETRVVELKDLGAVLNDYKLGMILFRGYTPHNKRLLVPFMQQNTLFATLDNLTKLANWMDEMDEDPNPEKDDTLLSANVAEIIPPSIVNPNMSHYGPTDGNTQGTPAAPTFNVGSNPGGRGNDSRGGRGNNYGRGRGGYKGNNYNPNYRREMGRHNSTVAPNTTPNQSVQTAPIQRKNNNFVVPMPNNPHKNLTFEIEPNGYHGWFMNGERIQEPVGMGQQSHPTGRRDDVRDTGSNSHLSANLAIEVINDIITPFVYKASYYSLHTYSRYAIEALVAIYLMYKSSFFSKDLLGAFYDLKANTDCREEERKSKEYFEREFGRQLSRSTRDIMCYPVEIITDLRESDDEGDEPTEEEIKAAMALLNRSKKRKEKKVVTQTY